MGMTEGEAQRLLDSVALSDELSGSIVPFDDGTYYVRVEDTNGWVCEVSSASLRDVLNHTVEQYAPA